MERYEAILEQLKKAQSRGMETFSTRFDIVAASLEKMVQEAKTSVQEALPQSADQCFPTEDIEEALRAFRDEAEAERKRADELTARLNELNSTRTEDSRGASIELLRCLDRARSQSELLKELLPTISQYVARSVVLVLREGKASAWSGIGFTDGERLRGWQGDAAESTALAHLIEAARPLRFAPSEDPFFADRLTGEEPPLEILLIPVVLRGKLMGAVYVDHIEGHPWDPEMAQSLVAQVCWLIDTLQFRPDPAPALAEPVTLPVADAFAPDESPIEAIAAEAVPEEDPSATMRIDVSKPAGAGETQKKDEPEEEGPAAEEPVEVEIPSDSFEPEPPTEPEAIIAEESFAPPAEESTDFVPSPDEPSEEPEPAGETADEVAPPEAETIPTEVLPVTPPTETFEDAEDVQHEEPPEPEPAPAAEIATPKVAPVTPPADEEPASRFPDEPPPVQPVQPPPDQPEEEMSEDEAQQEEARRFARLLISEIKLYNEEQVDRGREAKDLYSRLKEDIDRSREMFDKRISEDVRSRQDYFQDELVRILADGNPDALGM